MDTANFEYSDIIQKIISNENMMGLKTSFEDEGADFIEVLYFKTFCDRNNIPLTLKIAGAEAIRDIKDANKLQIKKLVAPMIESKFALEKFIQSCNKFYTVPNHSLTINVESKTCYENIESIFSSPHIKSLSSITVGRGDLVQSFEHDRYDGSVDSDEVMEMCVRVFTLAREHGLGCTLGGSMTTHSEQFVKTLVSKGLLDKFETRNVMFNVSCLDEYRFDELIDAALDLELHYLVSKRDYYSTLYQQDISRINKLSGNV